MGFFSEGIFRFKNGWASFHRCFECEELLAGVGGGAVCSKMTCFRSVCYFTRQHNVKQTICSTVVK